jgi:hypothetical protein
VGTVDAVAYALASDALDNDGPADPERIPADVCAQPYMPGIDPVTGPGAGLQAFYDDESSTGPETPSEPPLACYVFADCPIASSPGNACTTTGGLRLHLHAVRRERIVRASAWVDGRRVARRRGHRLHWIRVRPLSAGRHVIRVYTRASNGVRRISVRHVRDCRVGRARNHRLR